MSDIGDDIRSKMEKACSPIYEFYETLSEQIKKVLPITALESKLNEYYDHSGYCLEAVHVRMPKPDFAHDMLIEVVLDYINKKYKLNGVQVFGKTGLNLLPKGEGFFRAEQLEPLRGAIEKYIEITSDEEFKRINNMYDRDKKDIIELNIRRLKKHFGME